MSKPFSQRNSSETATRKIKALSKRSKLDVDIVKELANLTWDFDPEFGNEPCGWVKNDDLCKGTQCCIARVAEYLDIQEDFKLTRVQAEKDLIRMIESIGVGSLYPKLLQSVSNKSYTGLSEFSSFFYLQGVNSENIGQLNWNKDLDALRVARNLFLKIFRGGAVERENLDYLWCDFNFPLCKMSEGSKPNSWLDELVSAIGKLPKDSSLSDLVKASNGILPGDKRYKQEVLQALSYAGVIEVSSISLSDIFIPDRRNELSPHFYSNEWTFPLRFWSSNGGGVNNERFSALKSIK